MTSYPKIASYRSAAALRTRLRNLGLDLDLDDEILPAQSSPLAQPLNLPSPIAGRTSLGNRFAALPMEGWDGTKDGKPSDLTTRRWRHFGMSGAKLIWGGEAVAVRHDGRANPNQLLINEANMSALEELLREVINQHQAAFGNVDNLLVGVQLTHSGRYAKPYDQFKSEPIIAYHHPYLDRRLGLPSDYPLISDSQLDELVRDFVHAASRAQKIGFHFVDIKHCHGYLGHELLSAYSRPGRYGGSFENRTRFLCEVVRGIQRDAPGLGIGVRFSAFDTRPYRKGPGGTGEPEPGEGAYTFAFGSDGQSGLDIDLAEPIHFLSLLRELDVRLVCITGGSPYYNPHIQRPAMFPPSDGYQPPEDPLASVARQIKVTSLLKQRFPDLVIVGSGYSYLQEFITQVAQYQVRAGHVDLIGLGRMMLCYPNLPADVLDGKGMDRKRLCRTFSDCTTAPRKGLVSGCYPLDGFYGQRPEAIQLKRLKKESL